MKNQNKDIHFCYSSIFLKQEIFFYRGGYNVTLHTLHKNKTFRETEISDSYD